MKFCGRSVFVDVACPKNEKMIICANFSRCDESDNEINENDIISHDKLKNKKNNQYIYYFGKVTRNHTHYEINSNLKAWTMNDRLSKEYQQYTFNVYLLIKMQNSKNEYKCVCVTKSPSFSIISSRRYRNTFKSDKKVVDSLDITNDKDTFKFNHLMPRLFDKTTTSNVKSKIITENKTVSKRNIYDHEIKICNYDYINREELSFFGSTLEEARKNAKIGYLYLDKYGNKHIMKADFNEIEFDKYIRYY